MQPRERPLHTDMRWSPPWWIVVAGMIAASFMVGYGSGPPSGGSADAGSNPSTLLIPPTLEAAMLTAFAPSPTRPATIVPPTPTLRIQIVTATPSPTPELPMCGEPNSRYGCVEFGIAPTVTPTLYPCDHYRASPYTHLCVPRDHVGTWGDEDTGDTR